MCSGLAAPAPCPWPSMAAFHPIYRLSWPSMAPSAARLPILPWHLRPPCLLLRLLPPSSSLSPRTPPHPPSLRPPPPRTQPACSVVVALDEGAPLPDVPAPVLGAVLSTWCGALAESVVPRALLAAAEAAATSKVSRRLPSDSLLSPSESFAATSKVSRRPFCRLICPLPSLHPSRPFAHTPLPPPTPRPRLPSHLYLFPSPPPPPTSTLRSSPPSLSSANCPRSTSSSSRRSCASSDGTFHCPSTAHPLPFH